MDTKALEAAKAAFAIEAEEVLRARDVMDFEAFSRAVDALSHCERIAASGCGHSGIACRHFAHLCCCVERPARCIVPSEAVHGAMGFVQKGDVMVLASRGGKTSELIPVMEIARKKGATIISITEKMDSPLAKGADIVLPMKVERETDPGNAQSTSSFVALSAVFDALVMGMIQETGYQPEEFGLIHPGGAVGERLNHKAL